MRGGSHYEGPDHTTAHGSVLRGRVLRPETGVLLVSPRQDPRGSEGGLRRVRDRGTGKGHQDDGGRVFRTGCGPPTDLSAREAPPVKKKKSVDPRLQAKAEWGNLYRQNAFNGCMLSRGYVRLKDYQLSSSYKTKELPMGAIAARQ